jgi:hypothetical protein
MQQELIGAHFFGHANAWPERIPSLYHAASLRLDLGERPRSGVSVTKGQLPGVGIRRVTRFGSNPRLGHVEEPASDGRLCNGRSNCCVVAAGKRAGKVGRQQAAC